MKNKTFTSSRIQIIGFLFILFTGNLNAQQWVSFGPVGNNLNTCLHLDTTNDILFLGTLEGFWYYNLQTNAWTSRVEVGWIGREVHSINANPDVPGRIITGRMNAWFKGYLEISNNWGFSNSVPFFSEGGYISDIKYSASNPGIFYACGVSDITPGDLLKSADGGETWSQLSNYSHTFMTSMAVSPSNAGLLYISGDALVTKTINGGLTWSSASNGLPSGLGVYNVAMNYDNENSLICSNDNGLYRTIDGGENWEWIYGESCKKVVYNPVYPNTVAVITFNTSQILLSTNNGTEWIDFTGNFPTGEYIKDLEFSEDGITLYAASYSNLYSSEIVISGMDDEIYEEMNKPIFSQNTPNPFTQSTRINFYLEEEQAVSISVYNVMGKEIRAFKFEKMSAGNQSIVWDGKSNQGIDAEKGIYFYRISLSNGINSVKKMMKY